MDDVTISRLLQTALPMIQRMASAYERNPSRRDDLVQTILIEAWSALPRLRSADVPHRYIARIAHNCAADHVAKAVRQPDSMPLEDEVPDGLPGPEARLVAEQDRERLLEAIRHLPLPYRQVMVLALEGLGHEEISAVTGLSVGNVGVRLHRARDRLRKQLGASP